MKNIVEKVLKHKSIQDRPPVLIDIGASGGLPLQWKILAPHSICVAFDADTRDFIVTESADTVWKKRYSLNRLVAPQSQDAVNFYLTRHPHCSSSLQPDNAALSPWAFSPLFEMDRVVQLPSVDLPSVLDQLGLDYIDWYKTDSQGTDLRIFNSLPQHVLSGILAAEFEPGIIDAYLGEDKLHQLMAYMDKKQFWISDMVIKGSQRIHQSGLSQLNALQRKNIPYVLKTSPGWCEIFYFNKMEDEHFGIREALLSWLFSSIREQHGFAMHIAARGLEKSGEPLFAELQRFSHRQLSSGSFGLSKKMMKKSWELLKRRING
jgi:hypothetical protein